MKILISASFYPPCFIATPRWSGDLVPSRSQQGEGKRRQTTTNGKHTHTFSDGSSGGLLARKIPGRLRRVLLLLLLLLLRTNFSQPQFGQPFRGTSAKQVAMYNNMSNTIESTYRNIQRVIVTTLEKKKQRVSYLLVCCISKCRCDVRSARKLEGFAYCLFVM